MRAGVVRLPCAGLEEKKREAWEQLLKMLRADEEEVEDDLETITGTQKLHGKMELSKQQWGFSFR